MEQEDRREIGFELKVINNLIRRSLSQRFAEAGLEDVSGMQGPMIGFIYDQSKRRDIFQKDIEKEFNIRRSTATVMLQNLEQKGMIIREPVSHDGRLKKILLTKKAENCHRKVRDQIDSFHRELEEGISPKEKEAFLRTLDRIRENLSRKEKKDVKDAGKTDQGI